ncbi:MAG TPA: NHL repeat-containing protein [Dehalococcoidia bacterium]|nr:NHL repeat-containing protein [Dehalococcoidia bacterium]
MNDLPYDPYQRQRRRGGPPTVVLALLALVLTGGGLGGVLFLSTGSPLQWRGDARGSNGEGGRQAVSELVYPARVIQQVPQPEGDGWLLPAAAVPAGDAVYVLDTGDGRILKLSQDGRLEAVLEVQLSQPMAMATDGERLYVADSLGSRIVVLDGSGRLERVIGLQAPGPDEEAPRPIGVAVSAGGGVVVSDAENHQVLFLDTEGRLVRAVGTGRRAAGAEGFNVPGGVEVDSSGYVYVVDTLNGRVVKLSPEGAFAGEFGKLGQTAGTLSRPKGVAVDGQGRVFVSDGLLAAVEVFAPDGTYLGKIGQHAPADAAPSSLFQAPAGLWLQDGRLYVMDRFVGLTVLEVPGAPSAR